MATLLAVTHPISSPPGMQLHLVIEDSGEITRDTCWFAFRRCLNLRSISIDGQVWSW